MNGKARFQELDVLRGFAALAVVIFHYSRHGTQTFVDYPFAFWNGHYGVQLFFVISGFVIYFTLERSRTLADFAVSRFSRLYPAYWAAIVFWIAYALTHGQFVWWAGVLANLTMLQEFVGIGDIDAVFWTLAVELMFYVMMAAVFVTGQLRNIVPLTIAWLVVAIVWSLVTGFDGAKFTNIQDSWFILPCAPYFAAGIMFYLIRSRGRRPLYISTIALALATVLIVDGPEDAVVAAILFGIVALAIAGRLAILVSPVTLWLGAISYPLYLLHRNVGYELLHLFNTHRVPHLVGLAITISCALLLAHVVSLTVERPAMRFIRRQYAARKTTVTTPAND